LVGSIFKSVPFALGAIVVVLPYLFGSGRVR
jgi:VIT1/CCC1 family predicted Fe2+/Mn2+ transporter